MMAKRILKLGAIGLGRAFTLMLPTFAGDARVRLVAAADPRPEAHQVGFPRHRAEVTP
jgi:phthalate 4,5-cis-dihydrodiol dehydrogenase